jgi:hypothetical protein
MSQLIINQIIEEINKSQTKQKECIEIITLIEPILKSFDGKQISKRIKTSIDQVLPECYVSYYGKSYSLYELKIWKKYDESISLNLGYMRDTDKFHFDWYVENNQRYYLDKSRYDQLEIIKNDRKYLESLVNVKVKVENEMKALNEAAAELPYPVRSFFQINVR